MRLLALSYHNIWPFTKPVSIILKQGCFLIKAPIGRGKSFLFFDGIMYGLYKKSHRAMLNAQAKSWSIHCLIEIEGTAYLIERKLTKTKAGNDSCQSRIFFLGGVPAVSSWPVFRQGNSVIEMIAWMTKDEIITKNETDLQQSLESILPPYELWINTTMIMQDSSNIFLLPPAQRMDVLKYMFDLLSIEDAEKILYDKKNELNWQIKALSHTDDATARLRDTIAILINLWHELGWRDRPRKKGATAVIQELATMQESLSVTEMAWDEAVFGIDEAKVALTTLRQQRTQYETTQTDLNKRRTHAKDAITDMTNRLATLVAEVQTIQPVDIPDLSPLQNALTEAETMWCKHRTTLPAPFMERLGIVYPTQVDPTALSQAMTAVEAIITQGKDIKRRLDETMTEISRCDQEINERDARIATKQPWSPAYEEEKRRLEQDLAKEIQQEYIQREKKKADRETAFTQRNTHYLEAEKQLATEQTNLAATTRFFCEKIDGDCPYITVLNQTAISKQQALVDNCLQRLSQLRDTYQILEIQKKERESWCAACEHYLHDLTTHPSYAAIFIQLEKRASNDDAHKARQSLIEQRTQLTHRHQDLEQQRQSLVSIFSLFSYAHWQEWSQQAATLMTTYHDADRRYQTELHRHADHAKKLHEYAQKQATIQTLTQTLEEKKQELTAIEHDIQICVPPSIGRDEIDRLSSILEKLDRCVHTISTLITSTKDRMLQATTLKHQAEKIGNLHHLMKHELVLLALNHYLPTIEDTMNALLAQVVDYRVQMTIAGDSKLELDIMVHDSLGSRDIKSLSGGQNTLIRLCWTLAVAAFQRSPAIFLDETINNLDQEAIGRVADLIASIVKQQTKSLYIVTHSETIQAMSIWNETVHID